MDNTIWMGAEQVLYYSSLPGAAGLLCVLMFMGLSRKRGRVMLLSLSAAAGLNLLLKALFRVPQPWIAHPEAAPRFAEGGYALPCLHTQIIAAVLCAFALTSERRFLRFLCAAGICLTGAARIAGGLQSVKDVLSGAAAGILCAALLCRFVYFGKSPAGRWIALAAAGAAGLASALIFGDGWGLGTALSVLFLKALEKVFRRADSGRTRFGKCYGTVLAAGVYTGLYIFLPFLIEWLLTPLWPGQTLTVFLITALPCLLGLFQVF